MCKLLQQRISCRLPTGIAYDLQAGNAQLYQYMCCRMRTGMLYCTLDPAFKLMPVYQSGKHVMRCLVCELPVVTANTPDNCPHSQEQKQQGDSGQSEQQPADFQILALSGLYSPPCSDFFIVNERCNTGHDLLLVCRSLLHGLFCC